MDQKVCSKCHQPKDFSEFHRDSKSSDGLASRCKECKRETRKKRYQENPVTGAQWNREHRESILENMRKYKNSIKKFTA
ncbi:MAG: hypothetical protein GF411_14015 [Candidatus Lokiarchaeota archaeon]|nr:hypothetical protein [Candidatus Lokiarchaeota archaeon]